jgi:hypothetical protein
VKEAIARGERFAAPPPARLVARRRSTGGLGDLGLAPARARLRRAAAWNARERGRFTRALQRLAGRTAPLPGGTLVRPR